MERKEAVIPQYAAVTDGDLVRARQDPDFRHKLVASNLEVLLEELNRLRAGQPQSGAGAADPRGCRPRGQASRPASAHRVLRGAHQLKIIHSTEDHPL